MLVAFVLIAIVWFAFIAPSERRYHERKLKLMQERIERQRQRAAETAGEGRGGSGDEREP